MSDYTPLIKELSPVAEEQARIEFEGFSNDGKVTKKTLVALKEGSHQAFDKVFNSYHAPLKRYLTARLGSDDEAQEMAQEVFIRLWTRHEEIDPDKNIKWFLYSTAKFLTLDNFRHRKVESRYEEFIANAPQDFALSADDEVIANELLLLAKITIDRMPPQRQKVFRMRFEECKSNEEIASELGLSPETIKSHLTVGKKEIQSILTAFFILFMCC